MAETACLHGYRCASCVETRGGDSACALRFSLACKGITVDDATLLLYPTLQSSTEDWPRRLSFLSPLETSICEYMCLVVGLTKSLTFALEEMSAMVIKVNKSIVKLLIMHFAGTGS